MLTGRASRWLQLLQDFGHIDAESSDRLLIFVADRAARDHQDQPHQWVDLPEVRRAAAILLARELAERPDPPDLLEEDWPLFFS